MGALRPGGAPHEPAGRGIVGRAREHSAAGGLTDAAERLIEACDLDGYSEIEFRRDAQGRPRLMEINPRLSASVEIAVRARVDFPMLLYGWAVGRRCNRCARSARASECDGSGAT